MLEIVSEIIGYLVATLFIFGPLILIVLMALIPIAVHLYIFYKKRNPNYKKIRFLEQFEPISPEEWHGPSCFCPTCRSLYGHDDR